MSKKLRKIFTISVMAITILSMSGMVAPSANYANAAASAGDLIKMAGLSTVYYLGADGKRYVFPNETTYFSWYSDWSGVVTVPQSELENYMLGANVVIRPGTKLVKITTNPNVYAVEPNGVLRSIVSEANATNLYGANWTKRVVDVPDAFFTNYTIGTPLALGVYPAGTLIKTADAATVSYIDVDGKVRAFGGEADFVGNRFNWKNILTVYTGHTMPASGAVLALNSSIIDTSQGGGGSGILPGVGTGMTVALSANTAVSGNVINGQALANLASFNFTAANDGAVKVTTLKAKRIGISQDATLSNVYLYDGATRLTDSASVSSGMITWSNAAGLFEVSAGTTKTITVKADISSDATGIVGVSIDAASGITTNGASVSGSFPVSGNTMSVITVTNLSTVALAIALPSGHGTVNPGDTDVSVFKSTAAVNKNNVNLKYLRLREIGTMSMGDLKNFNLYVGNIKVAGPVEMSNDMYVTFNLSASPVSIVTGSKDIEVKADVINGSSKTYSFSLRQSVDIVVEDAEYNVPVTVTGVPATTGVQTIASGSMTVVKATNSPSGNVIKDASSVTLAKYTITAFGEAIKIETLKAGIASGNDGTIGNLRNGKIMINGGQYGSTANLTTTGVNFTVNYTVNPGTPATVEIVADIFDNDGANNVTAGDTLTASLMASIANGQAQTSLSSINVPGATVAGNQTTVAVGSLVMAKVGTYANQITVVPQTAYKIAAYTLTGGSAEDTNLNTISVDFTVGGGIANLTNVYVKHDATQTSIKSNVNATGNTFSINRTLAKNGQITIEVYGTLSSTVTNVQATITVSGTTANSSTSVNTTAITGQTITAGTGSITATLDASSAIAKIVAENTSVDAATFKFNAVYDTYTLTEIIANIEASGSTVIANAKLYDGAILVSTGNISGTTITFPMSLAVSANKILTVKLTLSGVGAGAGTTGSNVKITLASYKANNSAGVETVATPPGIAGANIYAYKSVPTITNTALGTTILESGINSIAKVTASSTVNSIAWKEITFTVGKTSALVLTSAGLYDGTTLIPGSFTLTTVGAGSTAGTVKFVATNEQTVSGSKIYTLKVDVAGIASGYNYVSTKIAQPSVFAVSDTYANVAITTPSFVWSDVSANNHLATTADWSNDFLVLNLATDSQTMSVTNQ